MTGGERPGDRASRVRMASVFVRAAHLVAICPPAGAVLLGAEGADLHAWWWLAGLTGALLLAVELVRHPTLVREGAGLAVVLKLALLGAIALVPGAGRGWVGAAIVVAAVGAHAPRTWRHRRLV
jgi:hypothetical protein